MFDCAPSDYLWGGLFIKGELYISHTIADADATLMLAREHSYEVFRNSNIWLVVALAPCMAPSM